MTVYDDRGPKKTVRKKNRAANMGWAKTMVRKSNQKVESDDPVEIVHNKGFCAGLRYAVAAAGFKYSYDEESKQFEVVGRRDD
jgi:hypothetical protein